MPLKQIGNHDDAVHAAPWAGLTQSREYLLNDGIQTCRYLFLSITRRLAATGTINAHGDKRARWSGFLVSTIDIVRLNCT